MNSRLAIITARGGSKRIPQKNIKLFHGKPIIAYSIEAALKSECFNEVMVSTDDEKIANIAKNLGAKVPFMRSVNNSSDFASTSDVLLEVISEYQKEGRFFEQCCCLYPTAAFVTAELIKESMNILEESGAKSLIPVAPFPSPIHRALVIKNGFITRLYPQFEKFRSQDLPVTYLDVGQFYWFYIEHFLSHRTLITSSTLPFIVSTKKFQDIDTLNDWEEAEIKFEILNKNKI